jgi:serine protease AprX
MAAPYVAGVVAQLFQADPTLTPAEVESILESSAHPFTAGGAYESDPAGGTTSFDKGHGLVDVFAALGAVQPVTTSSDTCTKPGAKGACKPAKGAKR